MEQQRGSWGRLVWCREKMDPFPTCREEQAGAAEEGSWNGLWSFDFSAAGSANMAKAALGRQEGLRSRREQGGESSWLGEQWPSCRCCLWAWETTAALLSQYHSYRQVPSLRGLLIINPCATDHLLL